MEPEPGPSQEGQGPAQAETKFHKVTYSESPDMGITGKLNPNWRGAAPTRRDYEFQGPVFDILVYLDSQPKNMYKSSTVRKDLYTIYTISSKLGCYRPRGILSRYQVLQIADDLQKGLLDYHLLYVTDELLLPRLEPDMSLDLLTRLLEKYKRRECTIIGEFSGGACYLRGSWDLIERTREEMKEKGVSQEREKNDGTKKPGCSLIEFLVSVANATAAPKRKVSERMTSV